MCVEVKARDLSASARVEQHRVQRLRLGVWIVGLEREVLQEAIGHGDQDLEGAWIQFQQGIEHVLSGRPFFISHGYTLCALCGVEGHGIQFTFCWLCD